MTPDATDILRRERADLEQRFVHAGATGAGVADLLLMLELRFKLEEQSLLPALAAAGADGAPAVLARIDGLRDLALKAAAGPRPALAVLEGAVRMHLHEVDELMEEAPAALDRQALADDLAGLLARWRDELRDGGLADDEEADPVGRPPR